MESFSTHILGIISLHVRVWRLCFLIFVYSSRCWFVDRNLCGDVKISFTITWIKFSFYLKTTKDRQTPLQIHQNYKRSTDPLAEDYIIRQQCKRRGFSEVLDLLNDRGFVILELYLFHFDMYLFSFYFYCRLKENNPMPISFL